MNSGVRRLVVDVIRASDDRDVAYAFARREYAFEGICEDDTDGVVLPGPFVVCEVVSLREFIEQFPRLSKREMSLIANRHGMQFRTRLTTKMRKDALRRHACVPHCAQVLYRFRVLDRSRKVTFVPPMDEPRNPLDEIGELRHKEKKWTRVQRRKLREGERESDVSQEYPPVRSFDDKAEIIRQWQAVMDPEKLTRGVCAVCARVFDACSLHDVTPNEEMLVQLRNDLLPVKTRPSTYDFELYHRALLHPSGMGSCDTLADLQMCSACRNTLGKKTPVLPKDAIANFQYYGMSELPQQVRDAIRTANPFEVMLVALCRATVITHHYQSKSFRGRLPEEASQRFNRGNVAILPQDPGALHNILPPPINEIEGSVCVIFAGGKFTPTKETLKQFPPVLVSKGRVKCLIEWLIANNEWYKSHGVAFSPENLESVVEGDGDSGILRGIQIHHLPNERSADDEGTVNWNDVAKELVMENVAYTQGDQSYRSRQAMKATALAHALQHKPFLVSRSGSTFMNDDSPCLLSALFPHLDPWGIGGFNHPSRRNTCRISLERQVKNLLRHVDSPFESDPLFSFICWNILQKRAVSSNTTFSISSVRCHGLVADLMDNANAVHDLAEKFQKNDNAKAETREEKHAVQLFRELSVVTTNLQGSNGYKLCRWNEIRSLTRMFGTPAFFITLNPHDLSSIFVAHYGNIPASQWRSMSSYDRAVFVASHPGVAARAFDAQVRAFLEIVVGFKTGNGLFGKCEAYYAMVEAQGRGTLHTHMLLWIEGNPNPERLRRMMHADAEFQEKILKWLEDLIRCELPGTLAVHSGEAVKPRRKETELDPRLEKPPQILEQDFETFRREFETFVSRLAIECNWHEHTPTCYKHLAKGEVPTDANCRMRMDGSVCEESSVDAETEVINLRRLHPWINNYNDVVLFLMQCNMDIKFIGSGSAAKALTYYISDYITKTDVSVHVGLQAIKAAMESHTKKFSEDTTSSESVRERNLLTKIVNAIMGRREISHQQVMSYLVGGGDYYTTHEFRTVRFYEFIDIAIKHEQHIDQVCSCSDTSSTDCPENMYGNTCMAYVSRGSITVATDTLDYIMCPSAAPFNDMSLWEFLEQTEKVKRSTTSRTDEQSDEEVSIETLTSERRAYTRRKRCLFSDQSHPQFNTHELCLRNKHVVPVLIGESIPLPHYSDIRLEEFSRAMLLLFRPWRRISSLLDVFSCWTEAFDAYKFKDRLSKLIDNFTVELECKDSRDTH